VCWQDCYFWATHSGVELDLLVVRGRKRLGFEFERTSSPRLTRSMCQARATLGLAELWVVYPGPESFPMADKVSALALGRLETDLDPLCEARPWMRNGGSKV
jgi:predicted AAA+ superfamily ATPase